MVRRKRNCSRRRSDLLVFTDNNRIPGHGEPLVGAESGHGRWTSYLEKSPAGSIQKANMSFVDEKAITSGVPASGIKAPGIGHRHQWIAKVAGRNAR